MKKRALAMVLVGGRGTRLGPITKHTAKPAVTFGGKYKLIDFVLSNLSHAFIDTIGIVTQYEPHALMRYIQRGSSWDLDVSDGGIHFLTPYTKYEAGDQWQKGTAHAIMQHFHFIDAYDPEVVLVLAGDHIYKMDYNKLIDDHLKTNADITISVFKPHDSLSRYGVVSLDADNKMVSFDEKPANPTSDLASMGIYVFKKTILKQLLKAVDQEHVDFGKDIIPRALSLNYDVNGYLFESYFRDVGTIKSLYEANMDLLDHPDYLKLHDYSNTPLYTKSEDLPPHHIISSDLVKNSYISDGSMIMGSVDRSILSSRVFVKSNALVKDSIIYSNVKIGEYAEVRNCIVLEDTVILPRTKLVFDEVTVIDNDFLWSLGGGNDE